MSIQASLNQLLGMGTIGAGIALSTPEGKEWKEVQQLQRTIPQMQKVSGSQMEEADFPTSPEAQEAVRQESVATQRLAQLRPTPENLKQAAGTRELRENLDELREAAAAERAYAKQAGAQEQMRNQASALDERKVFLQQLEALRAAGAISNKEVKSLTYKINKQGGNN